MWSDIGLLLDLLWAGRECRAADQPPREGDGPSRCAGQAVRMTGGKDATRKTGEKVTHFPRL